jgi:hypothetical protein
MNLLIKFEINLIFFIFKRKKEANIGYLGHLTIVSNLLWETYNNENTRKYFDDLFSNDG